MSFNDAKCLICGAELTVHQRFRGGMCDDWRCHEAVLRRDLEAHRAQAAKTLDIKDPKAYPIFVVPRNDRRVTRLFEERRTRFRDHLKRIVSAAGARGAPPTAQDGGEAVGARTLPVLETRLLSQACAACRGFCCQHGKEHAFLDQDRMGRYLAESAEQSPEAVIERYFSYLPEYSFEQACVYQSAVGCALPRDMRASICNAYQCSGLKSYRRHLEDEGPVKGFAVVREDNRIVRSAFLEQESLRPYGPQPDGDPGGGLAGPSDVVARRL